MDATCIVDLKSLIQGHNSQEDKLDRLIGSVNALTDAMRGQQHHLRTLTDNMGGISGELEMLTRNIGAIETRRERERSPEIPEPVVGRRGRSGRARRRYQRVLKHPQRPAFLVCHTIQTHMRDLNRLKESNPQGFSKALGLQKLCAR